MPLVDLKNKTKEELIHEIKQLNERIKNFELSKQLQSLPEQILINYKDYLSILDEENDAVFKGDKNGKIIYANKAAILLTYYNIEELQNKQIDDLFSKEELEENPLRYKDVLKGKTINKKRTIIQKNGNPVYVEMSTKLLSDGTLICIMRDITARIKLEYALHESESRYKLAVEATEDGIWDWSLNSEFVFYSEKWKSQLGYLSDELNNKHTTWIDLLHPDDKERMDAEVQNYLDNPVDKFISQFRLKHKNGTYRWIKSKASSVLNEKGEVVRMFGVHTDITEEVSINQKLIESEKKYRSLFDALPYGGEVLDTKGYIKDISPGTTELLGYNEEELIGKHVSKIIDKDSVKIFKDKFPDVLKGEKQKGEICMRKKDGSKINVLRAGQPVFNEKGKVSSVFTITVDISELKEFENKLIEKNKEIELQNEELKKTERQLLALNEELFYAKEKADESNRLKSAFLANMSHEIRTPMNGILGFSQLLMMPETSEEKIKDYSKIIMQSGKHLLNIINDIIDIAKIDAGQLQIHTTPVEINTVLKELYSFFHSFKVSKNKANLELILNTPLSNQESVIFTDETRFRQILSNLINNAVKFTEKGHIEFGYTIEENKMIVFVKDTGIGIQKDKMNLIFNRFMQAAINTEKLYGGTGLGLAISKACVKLLGGDIWVESNPGKGSSFFFSIPFNQTKTIVRETTPELEINFAGQRILIVEDDPVNLEYINEIISPYNLVLTHVETADAAIKKIKENEYDLILMDIQLPGKDGNYAIREIKKIYNSIPIIAQSAYAFENEKQKSYEAGCDYYITKPIQQHEFLKTINNVFN